MKGTRRTAWFTTWQGAARCQCGGGEEALGWGELRALREREKEKERARMCVSEIAYERASSQSEIKKGSTEAPRG